jgi:hypothetical protein
MILETGGEAPRSSGQNTFSADIIQGATGRSARHREDAVFSP